MAIHKSFRIMVVEDSATSAEVTRCWLEDGLVGQRHFRR